MANTDDIVLAEIDRKLNTIVNLLAYEAVRDMTVAQGAPILRRLGLTPAEIASVFDSTTNAVKVRLSEAKKKPAERKRD